MQKTYGFPGAEEHVCDDLGTGGRNQESHRLILRGLLTERRLVHILEHFVESKLSEALEAVAHERWEPSL